MTNVGRMAARVLQMSRLLTVAGTFVAALPLWAAAPVVAETRSLSQGWSFHRGESSDAEVPAFDDGNWRKVTVPHDWSIMGKPDGSPPFDPQAIAGQDSGYLPGGMAGTAAT